jgi:hypothetical protein
MPRILKIVLPPLLALGLGLLVGFGFGQRWGLKYAEYEVLGNLSLRMEAASLIRLGECDDALQWMDDTIDRAIMSAAANEGELGLAPRSLLVLQTAKLYRLAAPSKGPQAPEVHAFLAGLAIPEKPEFCPRRASGAPARPTALERLLRAQQVEW